MFPMAETYSQGDYKTLMNLVTHMEDMPESMMLKNAVISVFFLRFLQHGKYFKKHVPQKRKVRKEDAYTDNPPGRPRLTPDRALHPAPAAPPDRRPVLRLPAPHHALGREVGLQVGGGRHHSQHQHGLDKPQLRPQHLQIQHGQDEPADQQSAYKVGSVEPQPAVPLCRAGEEISLAYGGMYFHSQTLPKREYHMLKHYIFQVQIKLKKTTCKIF